jgi:cell division protein FtsI/penicillin-binding protein 2
MTRREALFALPLAAPLARGFAATDALRPALDRHFPASELNYLVVDARTREVVASRWPNQGNGVAATPIPVGSLVKPFLALAYGGVFPEFDCKGAASACWHQQGHGSLKFSAALAQSCNAYFLNLARSVDADALRVTTAKFSLAPPSEQTAEARIGLGDAWRIAPLALVRAYIELAARRGEPHVDEILTGLALAARSGTAKAIGAGALAKTGTAVCVSPRKDAGDGFALVLDPAETPRIALLVRVHNVPGAEASKTAARMLRVLRGA